VQVGLVAADGGLLTSPCTPAPAERTVAKGLANHVVADPLAEAMACAKRICGAAAAGGRKHQNDYAAARR
jgi:enoyl-CoA hydratase